ncbi:MAG: DUF308 domain-containing protein [Bacteroidota bacterium]
MESIFAINVKSALKHWYLLTLVGIIFTLVGIYTLTRPLESFTNLIVIFSWSFLITGIFDTIFSLVNCKNIGKWGWALLSGILNVALGIWLMIGPQISRTVLPVFVGFLLLFRAFSAIGHSMDLKHHGIKDWWALTFVGVLAFLFSFLLLWNPTAKGITITVWTGIAFISVGIYHVYFSLRLKRIKSISGL